MPFQVLCCPSFYCNWTACLADHEKNCVTNTQCKSKTEKTFESKLLEKGLMIETPYQLVLLILIYLTPQNGLT